MEKANGNEGLFGSVKLRSATPDDKPFLLSLFAASRSDELALMNVGEDQKQRFIAMQFEAQSRQYAAAYPDAENSIILSQVGPIGRLLLDRGTQEFTLVDVALLPAYRGFGIGTALIHSISTEAAATGKSIRLHVLASSAAKRLYERLGFSPVGGDAYLEMIRVPPVSTVLNGDDTPNSNFSDRTVNSMISYRLSPYVSFVENRLIPGVIQHGVSHRLTGEVLEPGDRIRSLLLTMQTGTLLSLSDENLNSLGEEGTQLQQLIQNDCLIPDGYDPLARFMNYYVARPIQNPSLVYRADDGELRIVRTSLAQQMFSPKAGESPEIIEEPISPTAAAVFKIADGTRTLQEILITLGESNSEKISADFRQTLDFLTNQERQMIKFTSRREDLENPYSPVNIVPRTLYHSARWDHPAKGTAEPVIDFHMEGIADASWEFDLIEPTVNHSFRFPSEALGGLDYGSRFAGSTLRAEVVPLLGQKQQLEVLEVGGGTGTFARSFVHQSQQLKAEGLSKVDLNYHILDLSPELMQNQRKLLSHFMPEDQHFHQDATKFNLPDKTFDLIISNEVIADFPMAEVKRVAQDLAADADSSVIRWEGSGTHYLEKYGLETREAPNSFLLNAGAFEFIERCFEHIVPGGTLLVSEYGSPFRYSSQAFQLSHEEFSIHFGHLAACAARVGFNCGLMTLKDFLGIDDSVPALTGQQEHFLILNYVLGKYGLSLPYAVISKTEFEKQFQAVVEQIELCGFSFLPISGGYHFGPKIDEFMILIMNKPLT
jgi:ribosomal protein S18 acetylase RimI-like enzyme